MKTAEGITRVRDAQTAWESSHAAVANRTHNFIAEYGSLLQNALSDESDALEEFRAIRDEGANMMQLQEKFLRAVAGR